MATFSIGECVGYGWRTFKQRPWLLIGAFLVIMAFFVVLGIVQPRPEIGADGKIIRHPMTPYAVIFALFNFLAIIFAGLGIVTFALRAHDDIEGAKLSDLWNPGPFWRFLGTGVLMYLIVTLINIALLAPGFLLLFKFAHLVSQPVSVLALVALLIPGVLVSLGFCYAGYLVVDRRLGPIGALKESWRITKGNKWKLLLFGFVLVAITVLGVVALVIGSFVAAPVALIAVAHGYRMLAATAGPSAIAD